MRSFEEFMEEGIVWKQTPNRHRAKALLDEAENKYKFLKDVLKNLPEGKIILNFIIETCYDILMIQIRAALFIDGYNVKSSHEAEVSYMKNLGFAATDAEFMNELRYNRNGIKYYGKSFSKEYAESVMKFLERIYPILKKLVNEKINYDKKI